MNSFNFNTTILSGTQDFRSAVSRMANGTVVTHETEQMSRDAAKALADDICMLSQHLPKCANGDMAGTACIVIRTVSAFEPVTIIMINDIVRVYKVAAR